MKTLQNTPIILTAILLCFYAASGQQAARPQSNPVPTELRVQLAGDIQGKPMAGLVHSGYTAEDPDGRNALLTVTLSISWRPIDAAKPVVELPNEFTVDVAVPGDKDLEQKLKTNLRLPQEIKGKTISYPLQMRLAGLEGKRLRELLTDKERGLTIVVSGIAIRQVVEEVKVSATTDALEESWRRVVGAADSVRVSDVTDALVLDLLQSGACHRLYGPSDEPATIADFAIVDALRERIKKGAKANLLGTVALSKRDFVDNLSQGIRLERSFRLFHQVTERFLPGQVFVQNPDLVKDLSTQAATGLDAICKPQ